jgi:hypothetical protein
MTVPSVESPSMIETVAPSALDQAAKVEQGLVETVAGDGRKSPLVFVSYRVDPDQPVAKALQRLLRESIDPPPDIFISNAGGVKPSDMNAKSQILLAAKEARCFVAIITQASKNREWISYEAGAAWGLGRFYAPLLIGVEPSEMPSVIGDYFGTQGRDPDSIELLVRTIAERCNSTVRSHSSRRYSTFIKNISGNESAPDIDLEDTPLATERAASLLSAGKREEAMELYGSLAAKADTAELKSTILVEQIVFDPELSPPQKFRRLSELPTELRSSCQFHHWMACFEPSPAEGITHANKVLEIVAPTATQSPYYHSSFKKCIEFEVLLGRTASAYSRLVRALEGSDRQLVATAAECISSELLDSDPAGHVFAGALGLCADRRTSLLETSVDASRRLRWNDLSLHYALSLQALTKNSASSNNTLAIVYEAMGLPALAYLSYERAAAGGVSVGKVNMARLLATVPVPTGGLALLREHEGDWDAMVTEYPFDMRATIERSIGAERRKVAEAEKRAAATFHRLAEYARESLSSLLAERDLPRSFAWNSNAYERIEGSSPSFAVYKQRGSSDAKPFTAVAAAVVPFRNLYLVTKPEESFFGYVREDGQFEAFLFSARGDGVTGRHVLPLISGEQVPRLVTA